MLFGYKYSQQDNSFLQNPCAFEILSLRLSVDHIQIQYTPFNSLNLSLEKMSVEILDGATIVNFLEDEEAFNITVCDRFTHLDTDNDGLLSYADMLKELQSLRVLETHFGVDVEPDPYELAQVYESLFMQFDHNLNGTVDLEEFKEETKQMLLAMADGMGLLPVQMALEKDSILKKAVERESNRVAA